MRRKLAKKEIMQECKKQQNKPKPEREREREREREVCTRLIKDVQKKTTQKKFEAKNNNQ